MTTDVPTSAEKSMELVPLLAVLLPQDHARSRDPNLSNKEKSTELLSPCRDATLSRQSADALCLSVYEAQQFS
jgi:hypothetical protein